jgi:hypothetical protein
MTPLGIDPVTFRLVAQCLNHCATAYPTLEDYSSKYVHIYYCFMMEISSQNM